MDKHPVFPFIPFKHTDAPVEPTQQAMKVCGCGRQIRFFVPPVGWICKPDHLFRAEFEKDGGWWVHAEGPWSSFRYCDPLFLGDRKAAPASGSSPQADGFSVAEHGDVIAQALDRKILSEDQVITAWDLVANERTAKQIVRAMEADKGCEFSLTLGQLQSLVRNIALMRNSGCRFTKGEIEQLATGEAAEVKEYFERYEGFSELNTLLDLIFDAPPYPRPITSLSELQKLDELHKRSTPGHWFAEPHFDPQIEIVVSDAVEDSNNPKLHAPVLLHGGELGDAQVEANWEFVLSLRNAFPQLRDALVHYSHENAELRKTLTNESAGEMRECLQFFVNNRIALQAALSSHDYIRICKCAGCVVHGVIDRASKALNPTGALEDSNV